MKELILVSVGLLIIKLLCDTAKFRWERTWWSEIRLLTWWRNFKSPFDLWHMLQGLLYTFIAYHYLTDLGYTGSKLYLYTGIWWAFFFTAFTLIYHNLGMKPEWRDT